MKGRIKKILAQLALLSAELIIVIVLLIVALTGFIYITRKIFIQNKTDFDNRVFAFLKTHVSERNNEVMSFFTFLGTHEFLIPANLALIAYFIFVKRNKWYSIKIPAIALSSLGLMFLLKRGFNRPRPDIPLLEAARGLSFPSGHALMSVTFYGLLIYMIYKDVKNTPARYTLITLLILLILVIGFSRIYLRVHYASDVLAGFCLGFLWLVFAIWLLNKIEQRGRRKFDSLKPAMEAQS